jgi:AraC-like DNA-binding protein
MPLRALCAARDRIHAAPGEPLTVPELAAAAGLSPFHFVRQFAAVFGDTPHRYLTRVRLQEAKRLLAAGAPVTDVCFDVGFSSLGSFSSRFHRDVGLSPREFQRRVRRLVAVPAELPRLYIPHCFFAHFGGAISEKRGGAGAW